MRSRWLTTLIVVVLLLPLLFGCASEDDREGPPSNNPEELPTATIVTTLTATPTPEPVWSYLTNANHVSQIAEDSEGNIWSVGNGGIVRWDSETGDYVKYTHEQGLPSNVAMDVVTTVDGSVWVGMSGGIVRYAEDQWTTFTTDDGLISETPRVLAGVLGFMGLRKLKQKRVPPVIGGRNGGDESNGR